VRREERLWIAVCDDTEARSEQLVDAIGEAVGQAGGEAAGPLDQWIRETAAHIVGDTLH
jgi:hypothetical protein